MRLLFWNLKKNANEKYIVDLLTEQSVDIAIFAEYCNTSFSTVIELLKNNYIHYDGYGACEKITLLCKKDISISIKREQDRYTLYSVCMHNSQYNIIGVHLPAPPNSDANDRKCIIRDLVSDTNELELQSKNYQTIVIGDFNCNPFNEEIIQKDSFNAVLYKPLIEAQETVTYMRKKYRRFYNPIINYISEATQTYGSFYYSSGNAPLYWNCFDQILVRRCLCENIQRIEYIKGIKGKQLIKECKPNDAISDHLPLLADITKGAQ